MPPFIAMIYKTVISFIVLIAVSRIMGRKFIGQMTVFDFAVAITLGDILAIYMTESLPPVYMLMISFILTIGILLTGYLTVKSLPARKLIEGEPVVVIQNGKILEHNMLKLRYTLDNLEMQLREKDIFNLSEVEFGLLEPNGKLSVMKKSQYNPVTPRDLQMTTKYKGLSTEIIKDGQVLEQNLVQNNLSFAWLYNELHKQNINNLNEVFYAALNTDGSLYIDLNKDNLHYTQKVED